MVPLETISVDTAPMGAVSVEAASMDAVSVKIVPKELFPEAEDSMGGASVRSGASYGAVFFQNGYIGGLFHEEDFVCCVGRCTIYQDRGLGGRCRFITQMYRQAVI